MTLHQIFRKYPTQESCIEFLERVRFGDDPFCPLCSVVDDCKRKNDGDRIGRWNCLRCKSSFNVSCAPNAHYAGHIRRQTL